MPTEETFWTRWGREYGGAQRQKLNSQQRAQMTDEIAADWIAVHFDRELRAARWGGWIGHCDDCDASDIDGCGGASAAEAEAHRSLLAGFRAAFYAEG